MDAKGPPGWVIKRWGRWLVYVVVLVEAIFWSGDSHRHVPSLGLCFTALGRTYDPYIARAVVVSESGQISAFEEGTPEAERVRTAPRYGEAIRGEIMCVPSVTSVGLLAPVLVKYDHTVREFCTPPLNATELAQVRPVVVAMITKRFSSGGKMGEFSRLLATGDGITSRTSLGWCLHDLLLLVLLCWAALSSMAGIRFRRESDLLAQNWCPECRYDLKGLEKGAGKRCPECGRELSS